MITTRTSFVKRPRHKTYTLSHEHVTLHNICLQSCKRYYRVHTCSEQRGIRLTRILEWGCQIALRDSQAI